ncbi:MAG TPA: hypothetical protein EYP85_09025 [Armatimonadetes bacterium]|nr:hypothetical protein [Armatimonadota bacterium]
MQEEVAGVRPSLLNETLAERWETYLKFRPRFRHSYGHGLIWEKIVPLLEKAPALLEALEEALERFVSTLEGIKEGLNT